MKYAYAKTQVRDRLIYSCYFSACGVNAIAFLVLWIIAGVSKTKYVQPCKKKHPTAPPPPPSFLNSIMGFSNVSNALSLLALSLSLASFELWWKKGRGKNTSSCGNSCDPSSVQVQPPFPLAWK